MTEKSEQPISSAAARPRKNGVVLSLCAILILGTAIVFTAVGDAPHVLFLAVAGLGLSFAMRRSLPRTTRTYVYAGVTVATLTVLGNQLFPVEDERFFLLPAEYYCPALIYLAVVLTFFEQRETTLSAIVGVSLLGMMLAGNVILQFEENSRLTVATGALRHFHLFYGTIVILQLGPILFLVNRADSRFRQRHRTHRYIVLRGAVLAGAVLLVAGGTLGLRHLALANEARLQSAFRTLFRRYFSGGGNRMVFPREADLWRTVPYRQASDTTVMIRAEADSTPGYLRGRVYETYNGGRWLASQERESLASELPSGAVTYTIFTIPSTCPPAETKRITCYPAGNLRSDVLLAPGAACEFQLVAETLNMGSNGGIFPEEWDRTGGYTVVAEDYAYKSAANWPSSERVRERGVYTRIPDTIRGPVQQIAQHVFGDRKDLGARDAVKRLKQYLQANCRYRLGVSRRGALDPVVDFLTRRREGHCELFAAAAVLLLRSQGIPARYVTGVVCAEQHPFANYWVGRMRDAHAWAEVYVADEDRWVLVEATPPSGRPGSGDHSYPWLSAAWDSVLMAWDKLIFQLKRGHIAEGIIALFFGVGHALWWMVADAVRGTVTLVGVSVAVAMLWRRHRRKREAAESHLSQPVRDLRRSLRRIERALGKEGVKRDPSTTLRDFAGSVQDRAGKLDGSRVAELLAEYEELRYAAEPPQRSVVRSFAERTKRVLNAERKR